MKSFQRVVAVSLNPAIDRVVEVPQFRAGAHLRGRRLARYPAGKGVNVARAIVSLGQDCTVTGFVGRGEQAWYGEYLAEHAAAAGSEIDCRFVAVEGRTRENISVVDPQAPVADTHIVEEGFPVAATDLRHLQDHLAELAAAGSLVAFCGSLPQGLSIEAYVDLLKQCLAAGADVAVDASGDALRAAAELPLWLIKPNRQELAELTGRTTQGRDALLAAATPLAATIENLLVSTGGEGAMLVRQDRVLSACLDVAASEIVGTVGCGDVLLGGFLAGWLAAAAVAEDASAQKTNREIERTALRRGVAAATRAATRLGRQIDVADVAAAEALVALDKC